MGVAPAPQLGVGLQQAEGLVGSHPVPKQGASRAGIRGLLQLSRRLGSRLDQPGSFFFFFILT